ncbi:hypothetical protein AGLY_014096, partial [Aphis glycines]
SDDRFEEYSNNSDDISTITVTPEHPLLLINNDIPDIPKPTLLLTNNDILSTSEHTLLFNNKEEEAHPTGRKVRVIIKCDTVQYRSYIKTNRNSGNKYITNKGKIIESRCSKELPNCWEKCSSKIDNTLREQLFTTYWLMKTHNRRTTYISGLTLIQNVETFFTSLAFTVPSTSFIL